MADRDRTIQFLIDIVKHDEKAHSIQVAAVEALGYAGGSEARAFLISLIEEDKVAHTLQVEAAKALGHACRT